MAYTVREACDSDWPAILAAADAALPDERAMNRQWLAARQGFPAGLRSRSHYVVESDDRRVVGYGAVEAQEQAGRFRAFVVMAPQLLDAGPGDLIFDRLLVELRSLDAQLIWTRELAYDQPLQRFFRRRGLIEAQRYRSPGGIDIVVMEMPVSASIRTS